MKKKIKKRRKKTDPETRSPSVVSNGTTRTGERSYTENALDFLVARLATTDWRPQPCALALCFLRGLGASPKPSLRSCVSRTRPRIKHYYNNRYTRLNLLLLVIIILKISTITIVQKKMINIRTLYRSNGNYKAKKRSYAVLLHYP